MAIVTISRGSYTKSKEVAEAVAEKLGYRCIDRDVLIDASKKFNIPEIKLIRAIHDAPSIFDRLSYKKQDYIAYIQSALLTHLQRDNVVYHGLAGQFFVRNVPHVLKVRIVADMEERIEQEMLRANICRSKAVHILEKDDAERRKWGLNLYGLDPWDPNLYDMVLHIRKGALSVDAATKLICQTVAATPFQTTPESQRLMDDLTLAAKVKIALLQMAPDIEVEAKDGAVTVFTDSLYRKKEVEMRRIVEGLPQVNTLNISVNR